MNYSPQEKDNRFFSIKRFFLVAVFFCLLAPFPGYAQDAPSTAIKPVSADSVENLKNKIDLVENINVKILNTVYWTLGVLSAVFLGLISVNLYFNITGTKAEIKKSKEDMVRETEAKIFASTKELEEKLKEIIGSELTVNKESLLGALTNKLLETKAELVEQINDVEKKSASSDTGLSQKLNTQETRLNDLEIKTKELEVFIFSQKGQQGAIINLIDLLKHDIDKKRNWAILGRLQDIKEHVSKKLLRPNIAAELERELMRLDKTEHHLVVEEIRKEVEIDSES